MESVARRYAVLRPHLDERQRRLVLAAEAVELGRGARSEPRVVRGTGPGAGASHAVRVGDAAQRAAGDRGERISTVHPGTRESHHPAADHVIGTTLRRAVNGAPTSSSRHGFLPQQVFQASVL